jgi:hypothetical protein
MVKRSVVSSKNMHDANMGVNLCSKFTRTGILVEFSLNDVICAKCTTLGCKVEFTLLPF